MPKILLIQPSQYEPDGQSLCKRKHMYLPGLALPLLAAMVPDHWEVKIINEIIEEVDLDVDCDLVGIGTMGYSVKRAVVLAREFKKRNKTVFLGGMVASFIPAQELKYVDSIIVGAGDISLPMLLKDFEESGTIKVRYDNPVSNLNQVPVPRYDLFPKGKIKFMMPIQSSRGCPNRCIFCSTSNIYNGKYLVRPIDDVIQDIREIKKLGYSRFFMLDDNVNGDHEYLLKLAAAIKKENMIWSAQCTINIARRDELLKSLFQSGCKILSIGLENINQNALDHLNKSWVEADSTSPLILKLQKTGFVLFTSFIIGTDLDTEQSLKNTVEFIIQNRLAIPILNILTPIPGTKLYDMVKKENRLITDDITMYTGFNAVHEPRFISSKRLDELIWIMYEEIYSVKNILKRNLLSRTILSSPGSVIFALYVNFHYRKSIKKRIGPLII